MITQRSFSGASVFPGIPVHGFTKHNSRHPAMHADRTFELVGLRVFAYVKGMQSQCLGRIEKGPTYAPAYAKDHKV